MSEPALVFTHHGLTLAVPARLGREAFSTGQVMPLPGGHAALLGLTEVRGRAVPLLNMSSLTAQEAPATPLPLSLLLEVSGTYLALPVTRVLGVFSVDAFPDPGTLLSGPLDAGPHEVQALGAQALLTAVRSRLALT